MQKKETEDGAFRLFAYSSNVFRIYHTEQPGQPVDDLPGLPLNGRRESLNIVKDSESKISARRKGFRFVQDPPTGTFRVDNEGQAVLRGRIRADDSDRRLFSLRLSASTELFGLGAFDRGPDRSRGRYLLRNIDTHFFSLPGQSYSSFPFVLFRSEKLTFGLLINISHPLQIDLIRNREIEEGLEFNVSRHHTRESFPLDLVLFTGPLKEILKSLAALTGQPFLPPIWSLGYHQSRWSYRSQKRVLEIAREARRAGLPLDAIHLDIHHMDRYRVFTWDKKHFPEPEVMHAELAGMGVNTVAIVDPGVAANEDFAVYRSGLEGEHFCKNSSGSVFLGKVWPGTTAFPDFTREDTRYWWARQHRDLFNAGVRGIWNDMNEPVLHMGKTTEPLDEDIVHEKGSHDQFRNLYANFEAMSTCEAFSIWNPGRRPFVLSRAAFMGMQKYAAIWTGDNHSTWEHLRENLYSVVNLGLSGMPFCGADVGGFGSRAGRLGVIKLRRQPELFQRWIELGSLMPLFRIHSSLFSYSQEPWAFGPGILELARKHILRRYSLLPYLYSLFWAAHRTGAPIVRPLFYEFPDMSYAKTHDQFMMGSSLLAAPVLTAGLKKRSVLLPPGDWYEFESGTLYSGGDQVDLPSPPGTYPLFLRGGRMVPSCAPGSNALESVQGQLFLEILPGPEVTGSLILDDGLSLEYSDGKYFEATMKGKRDRNGDLTVEWSVLQSDFQPVQKVATILLPMQYRQMNQKAQKIQGRPLSIEGRSAQMMSYEVPIQQGWDATFVYRNLLTGETGAGM